MPAARAAPPEITGLGPQRTGSPGSAVAPATIPTTGTGSAQALLRAELDQWGLGSLLHWAWQQVVAGASLDEVIYSLRQTPEYKARFAGNVQLAAEGFTPLAEADYLAYETQATQMFRYYGLPSTFYDQPEDFAKWIGGRVSMSELRDRVATARIELDSTPEVQRAEARLYGVADGAQLAYYLDPTRALPLLQRQAQAAQLAGIGASTGYGEIDRMQAERLAALGITPGDATTGFARLASMAQVTGPILGDTEAGLTTDEQLAAAFGQDAVAAEKLSRRQRARTAAFRQSGGYAPTQGQ